MGWADAGGGDASLPPTRGCPGGISQPAWAAAAALEAPGDATARIRLRDPGLQRGSCRAALLLPGTVRVLQQRALFRKYLCRCVLCTVSGPWGGTSALQRADHAMESQLLAAKHQQDMFGWLSAVERFDKRYEHSVVAYDADRHLSLVHQRGKSARQRIWLLAQLEP